MKQSPQQAMTAMATPPARGSTLKAAISAELIYGNPAGTGINLSVVHAFRDLYEQPLRGLTRHRRFPA